MGVWQRPMSVKYGAFSNLRNQASQVCLHAFYRICSEKFGKKCRFTGKKIFSLRSGPLFSLNIEDEAS